MKKTLTRHGNSRALVIEKGVLELLNITDETLLEITTDGKRLIIEPILELSNEEKVKDALDKTNKKFGKALKKLTD